MTTFAETAARPGRCRRCNGNLLVVHELGGDEWHCLQCGRANGSAAQAPPLATARGPDAPTIVCRVCLTSLDGSVTARRQYCSDRCRMRAARRRRQALSQAADAR